MGRHRKPTAWDRIRLRMVKFRRRYLLRIREVRYPAIPLPTTDLRGT